MSKMKPWTLEEYQEILNLPSQIILMLNSDQTFEKVNDHVNLLGWGPDHLIGKKVKEYVHPDDWEETLSVTTSLFLGTIPLISDFVVRCKTFEGDYRWISWSGKVRGKRIFAFGVDVTEKIQFEQELTIQALVLESISEGVVICNERGKIVYINSAEEQLMGYDINELLGASMNILNGYDKEQSQIHLEELYESINKNETWIGEWQNVTKAGREITTSCRVTTMMLNGERHLVITQRDITARKKHQRERDALQNRFRTFFEQSVLPMEIFDLEGNILEVNHAFCELFAITKEAFSGYNILQDQASLTLGILPYLKRAYAGEAVEAPAFFYDPRISGRQGRARWLEAWFSPVKDEKNRVKELAVVLKDVTERKVTEQKLEKVEDNFRIVSDRLTMAVRAGQIGIWEWKNGSPTVYWDDTLKALYGFKSDEFDGSMEMYTNAVHPDDRQALWNTITQSHIHKKPYVVEHRIIRHDTREVRWIQGSGSSLYDEEGNPVLMMGTAIDITDKKFRELDQKFIANISEILSSSFNIHENMKSVTEACVKYFCDGCFIDQLLPNGDIERTIITCKNPEKEQRIKDLHDRLPDRYVSDHPMFTALVTGKTYFVEDTRIVRNSFRDRFGEAYFGDLNYIDTLSSIVARLKGRESLLGTITFITLHETGTRLNERHVKLAEEIAYRMSMAFENSMLYQNSQEAIKARDEFLSIASHELKTPLTTLLLQNQMRKRQIIKGDLGTLDQPKLVKMFDSDDQQYKRINRLIEDMLDITRIRADRLTIHREEFEFTGFVSEILERFQPQLRSAGCDVSFFPAEKILVNGDSYRIEQVVANLLTNAMKYGSGKPVKVEIVKSSYKISLLVHDQGPGIDEKDSERIFQRFERAVSGREISGLGLGLYISRQIVEQHDGALYVLSRSGLGSTFIMDLPL